MTVRNRKDARESLATALDTITGPTVYDYQPKDFGGLSPVITVESAAADYGETPGDVNDFRFLVIAWVRRDDAAAAEDTLDNLSQDIAEIVMDWNNGIFYQESDAGYEVIDGILYRREAHFVSVDWDGA